MVRSPSLKGSRRLFRRGRTSQACSKGKTHTGFSSALAGPMAFFFFLVGTLFPVFPALEGRVEREVGKVSLAHQGS